MKIRVAITDDHPLVLSGLRSFLQTHEDIEVTGTYPTGRSLLASLDKELPDVLLLDLHLPDITGDEVATTIAKKYPSVKVIVLTSHESIYFVKALVRIGVKGYLLKTAGQDLLISAIEAVHNGETYFSPEVSALLAKDSRQKQKVSSASELTNREKDIIKLITEELTSQEIAERLHLSHRTVENYRLGLMHKLDVKNIAGLVKKAIELGLI